MMAEIFDPKHYQQLVQDQMTTLLTTGKKYYIEVMGNLIDSSSFQQFVPEIPQDFYKGMFEHVKYDLDVLLCIKASRILSDALLPEHQQHLKEDFSLYLKRVEHQYGVKPHIVITFIDVENMYDLVFAFETYFQKQGYRTWEKYVIKSFVKDPHILFSEEYLENDDHIPAMKTLNLIADRELVSGKTMTAMSQCYLDHDIDIDAEYRLLYPFFNPQLSEEEMLNQWGNQWYQQQLQKYQEEDELSLYQRLQGDLRFIQQCVDVLGQSYEPLPLAMEDIRVLETVH